MRGGTAAAAAAGLGESASEGDKVAIRSSSAEPLADRARARLSYGPRRLLAGEDPATKDVREARHWASVYWELHLEAVSGGFIDKVPHWEERRLWWRSRWKELRDQKA